MNWASYELVTRDYSTLEFTGALGCVSRSPSIVRLVLLKSGHVLEMLSMLRKRL